MKYFKLLDDNPYFSQTIDVRGTEIVFDVYQNTYSNYWYFDLTLTDDTVIIKGDKLVSGIDLGFKTEYKGIYFLKKDGEMLDPNIEGLADYLLLILDENELDAIRRPNQPEPTYLVTDGGHPLVDNFGKYLVADYETL